ncbi:hypothetical protein [Aquirufa salirivi]|uniref:Restriction endonuclease type IV Mrr domain-containing protein n=1 Tax=Aquirufa salirivi TaxID=3104729 RepID=A0ABW8RR36_9BACT
MSATNQLILLLESLEKKEFDKIVKTYLRFEYGFEKIVITDGKDDIGIDLKVFDFGEQQIQYQLTTQKSSTVNESKSFESKLFADLEKAQINCRDYGYKDILVFFYSKKLTNKKIREFQHIALQKYNISLTIIDANRLAEESDNYPQIQSLLVQFSGLDKIQINNSKFDNNLFYDLLSFGKPTEFKTQIIDSFVLQHFYLNEIVTKAEIISCCEEKFNVSENEVFYDKLLSRFSTEKKIVKNKEDNNYSLTVDERESLKAKNQLFEYEKKIFINQINLILEKFGQNEYLEEYIEQLKQLYVDNFSDLSEILTNEIDFHTSLISKSFIRFIEAKFVRDTETAKCLSLELLKFCSNNKFIQKIAATIIYSDKIDNQQLENYLSQKKKIFIDTSVGLYALCYFFKPNCDFNNFYFKAVKNLIEFSIKEKLSLFISERYIWEIQNQVKDAFRLIPFTNISNFASLGSSRNVFYNFYNYLVSVQLVDEEISFLQFLEKFGFKESLTKDSFNSIIHHCLANINIKKQELVKDYNIEEVSDIFEEVMIKYFKNKTNFAKTCDSIMLKFLADKDVEIHPSQPIFLTWDKTFFEAHNQYIERYPDSQNWLTLTPNRIVDVYALLKFSINSETITENLLALISDDIIDNTHSLVDTLGIILNLENEVGLEYTSRLANVREKEINQIESFEVIPPDNFEGKAVIDDIMFNLTKHFTEEVKRKDDFRALFTKKELIDTVIGLLQNSIKDFYVNKKLNDSIYLDFQKIMDLPVDVKIIEN